MLYVNYTRPERNEQLEAKVDAELKQLDSLLGIQWFEAVKYNERQNVYEGRYALTCRWPQSDKRWELYQRGEIGEPFDILGWFTDDMFDGNSAAVDPEMIWNKTLELLASADNTRHPWKDRLKA